MNPSRLAFYPKLYANGGYVARDNFFMWPWANKL